ncbi:MAG: class I SAM-dependent methyltransferase [Planctomycetes bacterium]|nr:class I SAM-dependent methyltransferase [Planctomycetota bacterium]
MDAPPIVARALAAYRRRGLGYVCYKILKRTVQDRPLFARRLLYRSPRWYWEQRGGHDYFLEQEAQPERTARSQFIAAEVARYEPLSLLEVGCGYGKQLASLRAYTAAPLVGIDWSLSQLSLAASYLSSLDNISLVQADGARLPFGDKTFDVVLTSAVLLHNSPAKAEGMRREICRVGRRLAIHNEDTNTNFSRFGYDTAAAYRGHGYRVLDCRPIPLAEQPQQTQFCVVDLAPGPA